MNSYAHFNVRSFGWQRIRSIVAIATFVVLTAGVFTMTGCGGSDSTPAPDETAPPTPPPAETIAAPGVPTSFTVIRTPETVLSATLNWSVPLAGGEPTSFEIYRSTTAGTVFHPDNHLISIAVVAGKTNYSFIDNAGLIPRINQYWVVSAKNAGGETPTAEVAYIPIGGGGGGDTGFGNNFSAALIFADDIGIGGLPVTGTWTLVVASIDFNTGLRPLSTEVLPVLVLPYFDPQTVYVLDNVSYYRQRTASTWQGQWEKGAATEQHVTGAWGDNLISQSLTANSVIRVEMVLSKVLTSSMMSYTMKSLYGAKENEIQGTDGTTYDNLSAFVFASNAHLTIQKLDAIGDPDGAPLYSQTLWEGDGPGYLAGEVNIAGNFTYGFVWNLKNEVLPPDITTGKTGTWRLTFSLDAASPKGTSNNTFIDSVANGVRISDTEVYIDINIQ